MRITILILLFSINCAAQPVRFFGSGKQVYGQRYVDSLVTVLSSGLLDEGAYTDAVTMYYDTDSNHIHIIAGAINATIPSNYHFVFDTTGTRIAKFTFPVAMAARADCPSSLLGGKITIIGGDGIVNGFKDVWDFDAARNGYDSSSWQLVNSDFTPAIGNRVLSFFTDLNGWFYLGGGQTKTNVVRTHDFITWDTVADLPTKLRWSQTAACVAWDKYIVVMGGGTETAGTGTVALYFSTLAGTVYRIDTTDWSIDSVYNNQPYFGSLWANAVANDEYIYYVKGAIATQQLDQFPEGTSSGNQTGMVRSRDGGLTWEVWDQTLLSTHAKGYCRGVGQVLWFGAGNNRNDLIKITKRLK